MARDAGVWIRRPEDEAQEIELEDSTVKTGNTERIYQSERVPARYTGKEGESDRDQGRMGRKVPRA